MFIRPYWFIFLVDQVTYEYPAWGVISREGIAPAGVGGINGLLFRLRLVVIGK